MTLSRDSCLKKINEIRVQKKRLIYPIVSNSDDPSAVGVDMVGDFFSHAERTVFQDFFHRPLHVVKRVVVVIQQRQAVVGILQRKK